jgi:uncharacterized iron-regulated membrane protein
MKPVYRFFWEAHKWVGIATSVICLNLAVTGFLLLVKKKYAWIQPPTRSGQNGAVEDLITNQRLFEIVFQQGHEDFRSLEDIDRVDFRPGKRVFKVRSTHHHSEIQIDAVSGNVLSVSRRPSDLIESIHDGSFFGKWCHEYVMPVTAGSLFLLAVSGLYLWLAPLWRKSKGGPSGSSSSPSARRAALDSTRSSPSK